MEEGSCCSRRDGGEANSLLFHLSLSFSLSLSANLKARQAARPPTPLPQCQLFSAPLLSLSSTTAEPFRAQEHSPKDNMSSVRASTHSLPLQVSKAFPFCCWRPIRPYADANYPDPPSTTFWFRPMSAASLFFCNPASASRCRHPHPDGNVTLASHPRKKEEEEKLGSFQLPLPLRPAACTQHVE